MKMDYLIKHKDLAQLGYYFLDREQEKMFLKSINDEFAFRAGEKFLEELPQGKTSGIFDRSPEEMQDYLEENIPGIREKIIKIREGLLEEMKEKRRQLLVSGAKH